MNFSGCESAHECEIVSKGMCPVRPGDTLAFDLIFEQLSDKKRIDIVGSGIDMIFEHKINMPEPDLRIHGNFPDIPLSHDGEAIAILSKEDTILLQAYSKYFLHVRLIDLEGFSVTLASVVFEVY